uniref:Protein kinase domain-containing protein n=1 Tax=viral metagenome TaxID=1070528 RepID=A0A6C0KZI9_9ZZZZ
MMFLFNYTKLFVWSTIYYFQKEESTILTEIIIKNIRECGCIAIKFCQWILPQIEILYDYDIRQDPLLKRFESLYEDCDHHSLEHTEKAYLNDFKSQLKDDFIIHEVVASGSIGQVYKVTSKLDNKVYALKSIHPLINYQITFWKYLIQSLYYIPIIRYYIKTIIPIDLNGFIDDFRTQTDLINESNNCSFFNTIYEDNHLLIIPEVYQVSKNILIMSYEEGDKMDSLEISDYIKYKIAMLIKLFIRTNEQVYYRTHGDLHRGNWKVRMVDGKPRLVIYDFGFCWKVPDNLKGNIEKITDAFLCMSDETLDDVVEGCYLFTNKICSREVIYESIHEVRKKYDYNDTKFIVRLIMNATKKQSTLIEPYVIQSLVVQSQVLRILEKYSLIRYQTSDYEPKYMINEYYNRRLPELINLCKTENVFMEYSNQLEETYIKKNIQIDEIFKYSYLENDIDQYPELEDMAIEGINFS